MGEEALADIVLQATDGEVKEAMICYNSKLSSSKIYKKFNGKKIGVLKKTAAFLNKDKGPPTLTKPELIKWIINRIENHLPEHCGTCNADYCVPLLSHPSLECFLCGQGVHEECFAIATSNMQLPNIKGLHWVCSRCENENLVKTTKNDTIQDSDIDETVSQHVNDVAAQDPQENSSPQNSISEHCSNSPINPNDQNHKQNEDNINMEVQPTRNISQAVPQPLPQPPTETPKNDSRSVCRHYIYNKCKYGISGKGCLFYHPKPCKKLMEYGPKHHWGCRKGQDCPWFHPRICRSSLHYLECDTDSCSQWHLKGTKRHPKFNRRIPTLEEAVERNRQEENNCSPRNISNLITQQIPNLSKDFPPQVEWNRIHQPRPQHQQPRENTIPVEQETRDQPFLELLNVVIEIRQQLRSVEATQQSQASLIQRLSQPMETTNAPTSNPWFQKLPINNPAHPQQIINSPYPRMPLPNQQMRC